ncbi:DEAD/DEAH box helicase [Paenibacillus eucommiae]|uniref:Superfamily II DNA or RNA helicase n=1 Tax=Paenibacillus eucommiae TaxID=1355755 RepID=A0ABS4J6V6_9BACL|nr:DEAD/DEAH box helicase [Paenibacillus eucommiae]MBP1995553.1 superfamily II DNA or RNA helicase [Paenibacillus eucommiae]
MSFQLTERIIKLLCGAASYERGEVYYREGNAALTKYDPDASFYESKVKGINDYPVTIDIRRNGDVNASCTCHAFHTEDNFCEHIAAVLLNIYHMQQHSISQNAGFQARHSDISNRANRELVNGMLGLFSDKPLRPSSLLPRFDSRALLEVEFICKPFAYGFRKYMFGIELRIGPKRPYIVQKLRDFLERMDRRETYFFSKHFTYVPELHSFQKENDAVIRQLIEIYQYEKMYRETTNAQDSYYTNSMSGDRMLLIPPVLWEALLPLLLRAPAVKMEQDGRSFEGIHISDDEIPLHFEFDQSQTDGYQLNIHGLDNITVMEAYGIVLCDGKLLKLQESLCKRLSGLERMVEASGKNEVQIPPEEMEPFMEKVIPGLMKLGSVRIAQAVSDRIVQTQLKAKLYLDRVRDRLLAGLEFQYGDIVINPLEGAGKKRGADRILVRDGEQEAQILSLMEQSPFAVTESGYFMDDEDAEYDFLYHIVPQLEKLLEVYATTVVKERIHYGHVFPKIKIDTNERIDWLEFQFDMQGIPEADIRSLLQSLEVKRKYHRLSSGALLPLENPDFQEIIQLMNQLEIRQGDLDGGKIRLPVVRGLHLIDSSLTQGNAISLGKSFRRLLENMRNPDNLDFPLPESMALVLRDYQKYGFQWLKTLAHYHFGGILADEMGLGKTLQSIAFIASVLPEIRELELPVLIVSPASLVYNWLNEMRKFAPEIRAVIADGSRADRSHVLKNDSRADVIITSYPLLRRDVDLFTELSFHTLFLDEAQYFKNHATQTAKSVKQVQARYRFALTGTPVENSLEELWSIFDVVFPQLFPGRRAFAELSREIVAKRIRPFLLRRLKTDVLQELPEKIESLQASELLPEQKKLYVAFLAKLQKETLKHLDKDSFQKNRIKILAGLTRLRQLCCHPALFVEDYTGSSAKFEQLMEIIEECRSAGKRMLIFSQFTKMLDIIGRELGYQGIPHFYLDGKTPAFERVELCRRFNEGEKDLFLISLKAGGTGLNLTGADTVILYDLWWNPAVEQQAADRAHRIGQKNVVQVIRLITQGTMEDKMYELQQKKKNLIEEVIQPGQEALSSLTEQDIREILMI